jgi:hypothetical protein
LPERDEQATVETWEGKVVDATHLRHKAVAMTAGHLRDMYATSTTAFLRSIWRDIEAGEAKGIVFILTRMCDKTPTKRRVLDCGDDAMSSFAADATAYETMTAKLVAHFRGFAALVSYVEEDCSGTYHRVTGRMPTRLHVVSKQTKEVFAKLLRQFRALDADLQARLEAYFRRRLVLSTADTHGSNVAAERHDAEH